MRRFDEELYARLAQRTSEELSKYTSVEEERRLQAGHWINLPLYVTQPVIPVFLYALPFSDVFFVILILLVLDVIWMRLVSQRFVSLSLSRVAHYFAFWRWATSLIFAPMLWLQGYWFTAVVAFFWPLLVAYPLFALHRFWPDGALDTTQRMFRTATKDGRRR